MRNIFTLLHGKYWFETNIFSLTLLYVYKFWCGIYLHYYMESIDYWFQNNVFSLSMCTHFGAEYIYIVTWKALVSK